MGCVHSASLSKYCFETASKPVIGVIASYQLDPFPGPIMDTVPCGNSARILASAAATATLSAGANCLLPLASLQEMTMTRLLKYLACGEELPPAASLYSAKSVLRSSSKAVTSRRK